MTAQTENAYEKALAFAEKKHDGQFRIGGKKYITHPIAVAEIVRREGYGTDYQIAALFHDLLEDTDATEAEIEALGGSEVLDAVRRLTKKKGLSMADYVAAIRENPMAFAVKRADRLHNLTCAVEADEAFRRKYILETVDWYWDFSPEIRFAAAELSKTLREPIRDFPLLYDGKMSFKLK